MCPGALFPLLRVLVLFRVNDEVLPLQSMVDSSAIRPARQIDQTLQRLTLRCFHERLD
jgi:hypothetical protein